MWKSTDYTRPDGAGVMDKEDQVSEALGRSKGLLESGTEDTCQMGKSLWGKVRGAGETGRFSVRWNE